VKLWYAKVEYGVHLGQLVTVWTPHISAAEPNALTLRRVGCFTTVFPERDGSCHFMAQADGASAAICRTPLGHTEGEPLEGLMTLRNFEDGGHELDGAKILVCVKSVGGRKTGLSAPS
jgi:hypothetical protein